MSNPILNEKFLERTEVVEGSFMTIDGTIQATAILGLLVLGAASFVWSRAALGYNDLVGLLALGGGLLGFVLAIVIAFTRNKYLTPVYAVCEGLFVGALSFQFEQDFPGIVIQAVSGTFATLFTMLILYKTNVIRATEKFRAIVFTATLSILVLYIMNFIASFFHYAVPFVSAADNSTGGIIFSAIVVIIAAANLIVDFDFIERGAKMMLPKDIEWYGAFGLMVTLIWLYIEILKLVAKARSRK